MTIEMQNVRVTLGAAVAIGAWVDLPAQLATREHIYIENSGVNQDWATAHVLFVRIYNLNDDPTGDPQIGLIAPGHAWEMDLSADRGIAVASSVIGGSYTLIESENIIRKGTRVYDA